VLIKKIRYHRGIYMLKYIELWNGVESWDGMHMLDFTVVNIT